jgi:hypothetical protein
VFCTPKMPLFLEMLSSSDCHFFQCFSQLPSALKLTLRMFWSTGICCNVMFIWRKWQYVSGECESFMMVNQIWIMRHYQFSLCLRSTEPGIVMVCVSLNSLPPHGWYSGVLKARLECWLLWSSCDIICESKQAPSGLCISCSTNIKVKVFFLSTQR